MEMINRAVEDAAAYKLQDNPQSIAPKPPCICVNGVLLPAPEWQPPPAGRYFVADPVSPDCADGPFEWNGDATDRRLLAAKLVYLTAENAQARGRAMLRFYLIGVAPSQLQEVSQ